MPEDPILPAAARRRIANALRSHGTRLTGEQRSVLFSEVEEAVQEVRAYRAYRKRAPRQAKVRSFLRSVANGLDAAIGRFDETTELASDARGAFQRFLEEREPEQGVVNRWTAAVTRPEAIRTIKRTRWLR